MRSPVIAFSIFAAAAVSPALVGAAPTSPNVSVPGAPHELAAANQAVPAAATNEAAHAAHVPRDLDSKHHKHKHERRVEDYRTAGGNAYTGASGTVSGGDVVNQSQSDDDEIMNTASSESTLTRFPYLLNVFL